MKPAYLVVAFVVSTLVSALGCKAPDQEACEVYVSAAQECALMSGDPKDELDGLCEDVAALCKEYFSCAAKATCKESGGVFRLDAQACTMPEGMECVPSS